MHKGFFIKIITKLLATKCKNFQFRKFLNKIMFCRSDWVTLVDFSILWSIKIWGPRLAHSLFATQKYNNAIIMVVKISGMMKCSLSTWIAYLLGFLWIKCSLDFISQKWFLSQVFTVNHGASHWNNAHHMLA